MKGGEKGCSKNDDFYNEITDEHGEVIKGHNVSTPWGNAIRAAVILISIAMSMLPLIFSLNIL